VVTRRLHWLHFGYTPPEGTSRWFFATTDAIENLIGTLRHVACSLKRWRDGTMIRCCVGLGMLRATARFRQIDGVRVTQEHDGEKKKAAA
jgi:hypothetical protein